MIQCCCDTPAPGTCCVTVKDCNGVAVGSGYAVTLKQGGVTVGIGGALTNSSGVVCLPFPASGSGFTVTGSPPSGTFYLATTTSASFSLVAGTNNVNLQLTVTSGYSCNSSATVIGTVFGCNSNFLQGATATVTTGAGAGTFGSTDASGAFKLILPNSTVGTGVTVTISYPTRFATTTVTGVSVGGTTGNRTLSPATGYHCNGNLMAGCAIPLKNSYTYTDSNGSVNVTVAGDPTVCTTVGGKVGCSGGTTQVAYEVTFLLIGGVYPTVKWPGVFCPGGTGYQDIPTGCPSSGWTGATFGASPTGYSQACPVGFSVSGTWPTTITSGANTYQCPCAGPFTLVEN